MAQTKIRSGQLDVGSMSVQSASAVNITGGTITVPFNGSISGSAVETEEALAAHEVLSGSDVHTLGDMSSQSSSAVNISAGTITPLTNHTVLSGSDIHGLGDISVQSASAVNISAGTITPLTDHTSLSGSDVHNLGTISALSAGGVLGTSGSELSLQRGGSLSTSGSELSVTINKLDGDLDLNDFSIEATIEPATDETPQGIITTVTVDANSIGVGCPLYSGSVPGHWLEASGSTIETSPAYAMALETGVGSKKVLFHGLMRLDSWNWTSGSTLIYLGEAVGTLTQTPPTGEDEVTQPVAFVITDDMLYWNPSLIFIEHGA